MEPLFFKANYSYLVYAILSLNLSFHLLLLTFLLLHLYVFILSPYICIAIFLPLMTLLYPLLLLAMAHYQVYRIRPLW